MELDLEFSDNYIIVSTLIVLHMIFCEMKSNHLDITSLLILFSLVLIGLLSTGICLLVLSYHVRALYISWEKKNGFHAKLHLMEGGRYFRTKCRKYFS